MSIVVFYPGSQSTEQRHSAVHKRSINSSGKPFVVAVINTKAICASSSICSVLLGCLFFVHSLYFYISINVMKSQYSVYAILDIWVNRRKL